MKGTALPRRVEPAARRAHARLTTRDTVAIYLNPQYPDAYRPGGVLGSPLLNVSSPGAPSSGRVELCADAGGGDMRVSYVAVLPLSVL